MNIYEKKNDIIKKLNPWKTDEPKFCKALNPVRLLVFSPPSYLKSIIYKHPRIYEVFKMKSCEKIVGAWEKNNVKVEPCRKDDACRKFMY